MGRDRRRARLEDLDDGCLLEVLKHLTPLPDLFLAARVCRRFRRLAADTRLWRLVTGAATPADAAGGRRLAGRHGRRAYATLHAAVAASRPGDTIELEAAQAHEAADVQVAWPIRLRGGGAAPEDTLLLCPRGADAALVFSASALLGNLSVRSGAVACLVHHRGRVTVQGCVLASHAAPGLGHLYAPLVTLARAPRAACAEPMQTLTGPDGGSLAPSRAPACAARGKREAAQPPASRGGAPANGLGAASTWGTQCSEAQSYHGGGGVGDGCCGGVLTVIETRILGSAGSQAVRASGSGVLTGVRAIPLLRGTLFWFQVDSAVRGAAAAPAAPAAARHGGSPGGAAGAPRTPQVRVPGRLRAAVAEQRPAGGGGGCAGEAPGDRRCGSQAECQAAACEPGGQRPDAAADADAARSRSKAWHAARHPAAALAAGGASGDAPCCR